MTEHLYLYPESDRDRPSKGEEQSSLSSVIGRIARAMETSLSPGDVAELRRLSTKDVGCPAFWKVMVRYIEPAWQLPAKGEARDDAERRWAAILQSMATMAHLHRHGIGLGQALAGAGYAELRFVRLLRNHEEGLLDLIRITARFLAAKGQATDWTDVAWLILSDGRVDEEKVRRRLARDYYRYL